MSANDAISPLLPPALKQLMSSGVCLECISRIFGKSKPYCAGSNEIGASNDRSGNICRICCGILQFIYVNGDADLVKHGCASGFADSICELVKKDGHLVESFSLEVSIPPTVLEKENTVWLSLKQKYGSEEWFNEKLINEAVSVKEALKSLLTTSLEKLWGHKSDSSTFRVRLTYSFLDESVNGEKKAETKFTKKRKTVCDAIEQGEDHSDDKGSLVLQRAGTVQDIDPELKVVACHLACLYYKASVYIGGRYMKFSRNVSQSRWIIEDERMGEASVEEIVGNVIFPSCRGDSYKFHAAGREDIDVLDMSGC